LAQSVTFRRLSDRDSASWPFGQYLLYVGARLGYKDFATLLAAYANWERKGDISLVVIGPPWLHSERELLARAGIASRVSLKSNIDDRTLCELYNGALAFVFPSLIEGFGIPLLEAMACGCPVVASRIPSTVEVAGDCPIYFDAGDWESLLASLEVASGENRSAERILMGVDRARGYSWERTAQMTLSVYRSLL
jgi:glycosyltransferase involved in cell wall biosynthesis